MQGYYAGFSACSGGTADPDTGGSGTFADGQRDGKAQGHSDAINGFRSDDRCGS